MTSRNVSLDYLRAGLTVLVIAFHSAMAYHPSAPSPPESLLTGDVTWKLFPVVDPSRWQGFAFFTGYCDAFFMSAMFFISGLFVWDSLGRKGAGGFLCDRAVRLGLPFLIAAYLLAPIAYYPSYLQTGASGIAGFWEQWTSLERRSAGPAWFLWMLLAFNAVAAALWRVVPQWGPELGRLVAPVGRAPILVFAAFIALGVPAYVAMELNYPWWQWSCFGPCWFQTSRIAQYFLYFAIGVGIGSLGLTRGLLAPDGRLARRWLLWAVASLLAFALSSFVTSVWFAQHPPERTWEAAAAAAFAVSCAASTFAFLAGFLRLATERTRMLDHLSACAYGLYLIHYGFVSWLQYGLLSSDLHPALKGAAVFAGALALSWATVSALRRIPAVARVM